MLSFNTSFISNNDRALAASFFTTYFDFAVDFSHDGWVFWFSGFKNLCDSRKSTGDVLSFTGFARRFSQDMPGFDTLTRRHLDVGFFRKIVEVEDFS